MSVEVVVLRGNIGKNDGLKTVGANKTSICNLSLAVEDVRKGKEPQTKWYQVVLFGKLAEVAAEYASKGREIGIVGRVQVRHYGDNNEKTAVEVLADQLYLDTMDVCVVSGRVGENSGIRDAGETKVCNLSLGVDRRKKDKADWYRVVLFGKLAEVAAQYATKGRSVTVIGHMQTRKFQKDGKDHYSTELVADQLKLGPKPKAEREAAGSQEKQHQVPEQKPAATPVTAGAVGFEDDFDDFEFD